MWQIRERASLVLEASVTLIAFLLIIILLFVSLLAHQLEYQLDLTGRRVSQEMELAQVLQEEASAFSRSQVKKISELAGIVLKSFALKSSAQEWFKAGPKQKFPEIFFDSIYQKQYRGEEGLARFDLGYRLKWMGNRIKRNRLFWIPAKGLNDGKQSVDADERSSNRSDFSPWSLSPLQRGRYFEHLYIEGRAHLGQVAQSAYQDGEGRYHFYRSMDLTMPTYQSQEAIVGELNQEVERFKRHSEGGRGASFHLIVPENSSEEQISWLRAVYSRRLSSEGIELQIHLDGQSHRP